MWTKRFPLLTSFLRQEMSGSTNGNSRIYLSVMSLRASCPQRRHRQQKRRESNRGGGEQNDRGCLQQFSRCPACHQEDDLVLILPCSHTLCGRCVAAGEGVKARSPHSSHSASLPGCAVLCPQCRHPVELPCWNWSSAASCLPKHPPPSAVGVSGKIGTHKGASEGRVQHVQGDTYCSDSGDSKTPSHVPMCEPGSDAVSTSVAPVGGIVDLREEEMERSVLGLSFALDPSTVPPVLHISNSLTVTYKGKSPPGPPSATEVWGWMTSDLPQVCTDVVIVRGQYYWEVDVCNSSVYRIGVSSVEGSGGWWLQRQGVSFCAVYDGCLEPLTTVPPRIKTLGVFLNVGGGVLSFHNPLSQEHLTTLPTRFSPAGVLPALGLGQGRLRLRCGLPPPPHVFLGKDSTYRGPCGAGGGRWCREIPFRSVRKVIEKFEELAVSDSDSGLVSSLGSSCSTLASLPDLGNPVMSPSRQEGQETGAE